jgi:long-chain acyl-CoA synthetase
MSGLRETIAERGPGEIAVTDGRTALTWSELDTVLDRAIAVLRGLDTGPAGRVAVLAHNSTETVVAHAAIALAGLSAVPVSAHLKPGEIEYVLTVAQARVVLAGPETLDVAVQAAAAVGDVDVLAWRSASSPGVRGWESLLAAAPDVPAALDLVPRPPLMFTSGTTGRPKPVEQPPTTFPGGADVRELLERLRANPLAAFSPHLVVGPLHHTGPLTAVRLLLAGTPLVVLPRFDAEGVLRAVQEHRVAASVMVPTHFARLLALPEQVRKAYDTSSLRKVVHTGAACPVELKRRMIAWWGPILDEAYGGTEVGTTNSIDSIEWLAHPGSVGRAVPPYEVLVLDADGRTLPPGATGRLCFRDATGRGLVYADPSHGKDADLPPDVFTLGEVGHVDADGYVYITDRVSDLVVSGGVNVYPAEVEAVLTAVPGVVDAAAFGVLHEEMGEELRALVVVADPALTAQALLEHCRAHLAHYKCPRLLTVVDELPRTAMGKLDKRALRAEHGAGVAVSG